MIYICGPMTGIHDFNYPAFTEAARALREQGHEIVSPHEVVLYNRQAPKPWAYYVRQDLIAMLQYCNAIARLPGWQASRGACLECSVAEALGFKAYDIIDGKLVEIPNVNA